MIRKFLFVTIVVSSILFSFTNKQQAADTYLLDTKKSKIEWVGKGVGKQHNGTIDISTGNIMVDTKQITGIYAMIDMKTIKCTDIKDEGFNKKLVDHLKNEDFFNIQKYPTATFKMTKATRLEVPEGQINYTISGNLTMRGITKPIEFPALVTFSKNKVTAKADITFDRTQWGITFNSGNYYKEIKDKMIEDNISLKIYLEANVK
jgi:polyisoprenoid-binding protein YceI